LLRRVHQLSDEDYLLFMLHVFDPDRPVEVKRMAVKQVAREVSKDAKANSKGKGGVGPLGNLMPCPPPPPYQRSAWQLNLPSL
jgi:hypothetical protein